MALQGKPQDWVGKPFISPRSRIVVRVTAYDRGDSGRRLVRHELLRCPPNPKAVGQKSYDEPEDFRRHYESYDPELHGPIDEPDPIEKPAPRPDLH